jgi:hypothetical protein
MEAVTGLEVTAGFQAVQLACGENLQFDLRPGDTVKPQPSTYALRPASTSRLDLDTQD